MTKCKHYGNKVCQTKGHHKNFYQIKILNFIQKKEKLAEGHIFRVSILYLGWRRWTRHPLHTQLTRVLDGETGCNGRRMNSTEPGSLMRGSPGSPPTRGRVDEEKVRDISKSGALEHYLAEDNYQE